MVKQEKYINRENIMSNNYWLEGSCTDPDEYDAFLINMGNDLCDNWRDYLSPNHPLRNND